MPSHKSDPRHAAHATRAKVAGQDDHRHENRPVRPRGRFVPAHPWTVAEVETALATADARQLVQATDRSSGLTPAACDCPSCGGLRTVVALGRWHWRCDRCSALGAWLALRQPVAASVECCVRLAELVHRDAEVVA